MKNKEKNMKFLKIILFIAFIALFIYITIELIPIFKDLSTMEGRLRFKENIQSMGIKGVLEIIGLMFAQVLFAILPGEPIELLAGMCYGPIWGTLIITLGAFISSFVVFFAVRKLGRDFIYSFASKERVKKIENSKVFSNQKSLYLTLFILFFIPGTPKDLIVYIGGLLPVKPLKFLCISSFARFPSIISSCIAGSSITNGNWGVIFISYGITFLISGVAYLIIRNKNKEMVIL